MFFLNKIIRNRPATDAIPMTAERWNTIKELFSASQERPESERAQFLRVACGGDDDLRREVEKLLNGYREDDSFLEESAASELVSLFDDDAGGETIELKDFFSRKPRLESGTVLNDRYEITRLLGRGGMGEVYLGNDKRISRNVALKVLHPDLVSSKESLRRFALEAHAVSALNHPHIMTIYDFETTPDGTRFIVAEYVDGRTLNYLIKEGLDLETALDVAIQVASALSAAHDAGITHRDIKPENIILRGDGYVKVLDFGLAKLTQSRTASESGSGSEDPTRVLPRTKPGMVMGTAAYMSPEQARGLHVDARADIFSLGAVIYEMLTGQRPFSGETQADVMVSVLLGEPPAMSSFVTGLPAELEWMVSKALEKDVDARYQTAKEFRADLEKLKKQIDFNEKLSRSAGGVPSKDDHEGSTALTRARTAGEAARATAGGRDQSDGPRVLWSFASFAEVVGQSKTHKLVSLIVIAALVALGSFAAYSVFVARVGETQQISSIAVLPFVNVSGNPDLTYVSDGLSEALIDRLSQLPQLKVIARSSSFKFRGGSVDVDAVASQLDVRVIVTGSVSQVGDEIVIRVDMVDTVEDKQLVGSQYRRKPGDLLDLQNEIAQIASERLRLKLTDSQSERLVSNATENSEAYRYYLSGLVELNGPQDFRGNALDYFLRAVELDANFAAAHTEIGWVYWNQANETGDPSRIMPKAKAAIDRALALDPSLAKAHAVQAMVNEYEFNWSGAELEYQRAIELSPNLDFARNNYAFFLSIMGRQEEALAQLEQQRIRDPINRRLLLLQKGIILTQARRFDDALRSYQEAQAAEPARDIPNFSLGYAYAGKGLYLDAVGYYKKSVELLGGEEKYSQPLVYLAAAYAKMPGKQAEARTILKRIEAMEQYSSPALLAAVYSALGENDRAMELLERAYIKRDLLLRYIGTGYEYDGLRDDPRFIGLTKRIGLAQ